MNGSSGKARGLGPACDIAFCISGAKAVYNACADSGGYA